MSYILDALRKSETERRQGKIPDLGQQVQLIHKPKKKGVSPVVWLSVALMANAGILAAVFWHRSGPEVVEVQSRAGVVDPSPQYQSQDRVVDSAVSENPVDRVEPAAPESNSVSKSEPQRTVSVRPDRQPRVVSESEVASEARERPVIITPSTRQERAVEHREQADPVGRVPHLVELPLSFQRSVPNLTFNSHIYSSDPFASRVMINSQYLRQGDSFSGLTVEDITEEGVVLSKQGKRFRVGIVRDWVSPR